MPKARFGVEKRIIQPAPEITESDVITQTEACRILGVKSPAIIQSLNRGRFTVVWDLGKEGGSRSARLLLRSEVEEAAAGKRRLSSAPKRQTPAVNDQ